VAGHRDEGLWWVCNRVTYVSRLKHQPGKAEVACTHGHLEQCSILTPDWAQVRVGSCFRLSSRLAFSAPLLRLEH